MDSANTSVIVLLYERINILDISAGGLVVIDTSGRTEMVRIET